MGKWLLARLSHPTPSLSPLDLSLINPAILGGSLSDTTLDCDDHTPLYGMSPQSLGGSTVCTTPTAESPSPIEAPENFAAVIKDVQRGAELLVKRSQEDPGCTAAMSPPCVDLEDVQPSSATPSSAPEQEEEINFKHDTDQSNSNILASHIPPWW